MNRKIGACNATLPLMNKRPAVKGRSLSQTTWASTTPTAPSSLPHRSRLRPCRGTRPRRVRSLVSPARREAPRVRWGRCCRRSLAACSPERFPVHRPRKSSRIAGCRRRRHGRPAWFLAYRSWLTRVSFLVLEHTSTAILLLPRIALGSAARTAATTSVESGRALRLVPDARHVRGVGALQLKLLLFDGIVGR